MGSNKPFSRFLISQTIKVLLCLFALIVAYLFALNRRFVKDDEGYFRQIDANNSRATC